ncbi:hypothetical protein CPB97_007180, partial [Podila verticillata]
DTIYENLSYCASLHQEEGEDDYMDEDDIYQDDEDDHEGLYADADIQGGYIPKSSSTTAIGHQTDEPANLARMESMVQDPHGLVKNNNNGVPAPDEEEPGQDAEEDRFKSVD